MLKTLQVKGQKEVRGTAEDSHLVLLKTKIVIDRLRAGIGKLSAADGSQKEVGNIFFKLKFFFI